MIELTASDGHRFSAYQADPTAPPKGAVIVLQEIFGVDPHIKKIVDRFAEQGYLAIAPALFDRAQSDVALGYDETAIGSGLEFVRQVGVDGPLADIQAAVDAAKTAGKVAVVGYCWGGYLAYLAANRVNGLACAVGYYGTGIVDEYLEKRKIPTLLHFGESDPLIPLDAAEQFRAYRPDVSAFSYPAAGHGFNCETRDSYSEQAADQALERTLAWVSQHVVGQPVIALKNSGAYAQAKVEKKKKKKADDDLGPPLD